MSEEIEKAVKMADDALEEFDANPEVDAAKRADWRLSKMRLLLGEKFNELHYYVEREGDIIRYLNKMREKGVK